MKEQNVVDINKITGVIKNQMKIIVIIMIISGLIGAYFSFFKSNPSIYEGKASIIIGSIPANQNGEDRYYEMLVNQNILTTYNQIAKSSLVAEKTVNKLNGKLKSQDLINNLVITPIEKSMVMEVKYTGGDSKEVLEILNTYSEELIETSKELYPALEIKILNKPNVINKESSFNKKLILINSLIIGFIVSLIVVFILDQSKQSKSK